MTSSTLFLLNLLMRVAHFWDILTSIFTDGTFKPTLTAVKRDFLKMVRSSSVMDGQDQPDKDECASQNVISNANATT